MTELALIPRERLNRAITHGAEHHRSIWCPVREQCAWRPNRFVVHVQREGKAMSQEGGK